VSGASLGGGGGGDGAPAGAAAASASATPIVLADAAATARAGAALAGLVRGGDAIALIGDLGAGKTTLVSGFVAALGAGSASSPTFSLINEYPGGRLIVWHVDLYRIEREAELAELGLDDLIGDPRGVCLIEWADRFPVMPPEHLRLDLAHSSSGAVADHRTLSATGTGPRGETLARELPAVCLGPV
jgi:tRNA threonylcarbamoyladenosine biosynthesis protein TsaE